MVCDQVIPRSSSSQTRAGPTTQGPCVGRHCFGGSARYTTSWTTICRAWRWRLRRTLQPGRNTQEKLDSPSLLEKNRDDSRQAVFGECPVRKTGLTWRNVPHLVDRFSWARCTSSVVESCDSSHGWSTVYRKPQCCAPSAHPRR